MAGLRLSETDLAEVLKRAQELDGVQPGSPEEHPELKGAVEAMVEIGISREAAIAALRERLESKPAPQAESFQPGDIVYCSDGKWYTLAKVSQVTGDRARVRLMAGTDADFSLADFKQFRPTPGAKVSIRQSGMWVDAEIVGFNQDALTLNCMYWGSNVSVSLDQVRLKDTRSEPPMEAKLKQLAINLAWAGGGGLAVFILTRIFG